MRAGTETVASDDAEARRNREHAGMTSPTHAAHAAAASAPNPAAIPATNPTAPPKAGVTLTFDASVATLTLDLAQPKNAFRAADARQLASCLTQVMDARSRCLVLRGAGPVFSAGWDISAIDPAQDDPTAMIAELVGPLCKQLRELPLPTIAAVAGPALGFGFGLALCCDVVLAEENALLGSPFRNIGMVPDTGTHHFLLSRLGYAGAAELIYTGRLLWGNEAAQRGLVNRSVATGTVAAEADTLARHIAAGPTAALRLSKRILQAGGSIDEVMAHEGRALRECFATADLKEGMQAFLQRRAPQFLGR